MKIKFFLDTGFVGGRREEIFEYEDNVSSSDIEEDLDYWMWSKINVGYIKLEEGEE